MTNVAVNSIGVQTKLESYFKHQMAAYKKEEFETAFLKAIKLNKDSSFNLALQTLTWPSNWCSLTIMTTPLLRPHFYGSLRGRNSEVLQLYLGSEW